MISNRGLWIVYLAAAVLVACGDVGGGREESPDAAMPVPDGAPARCDPMAPFTSVTPIAELNRPEASTLGWDEYGRLSPDGLTVYFSSGRTGGQMDIYTATRESIDRPFGAAVPLEGVNTAAHERTPVMTADGLTLLAMQSGHPGGYEIVIAQRSSLAARFGSFAVLANVNDAASTDGDTYVLPDGSALYFYSMRGGTAAIYRSPRTATGYGQPSLVSGVKLNQPGVGDASPVVSADELTLYFSSDRDGDNGTYVATRSTLADGFGAPVRVGGGVNTAENWEWPSWISPDGCTLHFSRSQGNAAANYDLYVARRSPQ